MADAGVGQGVDARRATHAQDWAMGSLTGQTVMITGASRGLGRALALVAAREGASLAICARGAEALEAVAETCREQSGQVIAVLADVSDARDVERFASTTLERFGGVDVLVNNAADLGPTPTPQLTDAPSIALEDVLRANVLGPLRLTQAVIGGMLLRNRGLVLNITSDAAVIGFAGLGLYSASKAALDALTRSWAAELAHTNVRVISVDPGDMNTVMHFAADPEADPADLADPGDVAKRMLALLVGRLPAEDRIEARTLE
jgi:NAD(P)-dependent dehydrogenase (short-subunit alcohol dehydrogenase family)